MHDILKYFYVQGFKEASVEDLEITDKLQSFLLQQAHQKIK